MFNNFSPTVSLKLEALEANEQNIYMAPSSDLMFITVLLDSVAFTTNEHMHLPLSGSGRVKHLYIYVQGDDVASRWATCVCVIVSHTGME